MLQYRTKKESKSNANNHLSLFCTLYLIQMLSEMPLKSLKLSKENSAKDRLCEGLTESTEYNWKRKACNNFREFFFLTLLDNKSKIWDDIRGHYNKYGALSYCLKHAYDMLSMRYMKRESPEVLSGRWPLFSRLFIAFVTILSMFPERYSPYQETIPRNFRGMKKALLPYGFYTSNTW